MSRRSTYLPKVCTSAMTSSLEENEQSVSEAFRNTLSTFPNYKSGINQNSPQKIHEFCFSPKLRDVKSVERYEKSEAAKRIFSQVNDKINEGRI